MIILFIFRDLVCLSLFVRVFVWSVGYSHRDMSEFIKVKMSHESNRDKELNFTSVPLEFQVNLQIFS